MTVQHAPRPGRAISVAIRHYGAWTLLLPLALLCGLSAYAYRSAVQEQLEDVFQEQARVLTESATVLRIRLSGAHNDLRFLAANPVLKDFLQQGDEAHRRQTERFFIDLTNTRTQAFDQLRYLDESGQDVVRVNRSEPTAEAVPPAQLQNKGDRPYFQKGIHLEPGQAYVSPMDLNVENGQVQYPFKPTLRLATRAQDAQGTLRGLVVINHLAAPWLARMADISRQVCWRQFKIDHLCQLNFDQGSNAGFVVPGCG